MRTQKTPNEALSCSFCQKVERQVRKIIPGPGVAICDDCVALCIGILEVELGPDWQDSRLGNR